MAYAEKTSVSSEKSRVELEQILGRYGADEFGYMTQRGHAYVMFRAHDRQVQFQIPLPARDERRFTHTEARGQRRSASAAAEAYDQAVRQKWRALTLCVKAKLEAVDAGISVFEDEFLANIVLPDGRGVGAVAREAIAVAYSGKAMPPMLGFGSTS